jgi:hypothetical protein
MRDGAKSPEAFLSAALAGIPILITGHSLGGCLASALAPCVANWVGSASGLSIYTIAAPSPGNAEFAAYYNMLFTLQSDHSRAFRFFNSLDVVPNPWASLDTVETYYPPLVCCPSDITRLIGRAETAVTGNTVSLERLRRAAQSNYPGPSSRPSVRTAAQCLRECAVFVGSRPTICLHYLSGVVANASDGSSSRHVEAGACGVEDVSLPTVLRRGKIGRIGGNALARHSASAASIIARSWISRKAITLVLLKRHSSTIRVSLVAKIRKLCARRAAGRDFDLIRCKSDLIEVKGNPSMVCRFRHDERRRAGSALQIENGANHAHGLN